MAGIASRPTKKRCLENEDDSTIELGAQAKRSKLTAGSTSYSTTSNSSSCASGYDSDSGSGYGSDHGNDAALNQPLTHRYHPHIQQQLDDETSSSGESGSSISSSCSSSSSSSSSSSGQFESETNDIVNVSGPSDLVSVPHRPPHPKPSIHRLNGSTLRSRLTSFLPQLRVANENLEKEIAAGNAAGVELSQSEDTEIDGQYIEMNLGLGVLEEQRGESGSLTSTDTESTISYDEDNSARPATKKQPKPHHDMNVMNKLMGNKPETKRPTIEDITP
ncbi:hypothetical protein AJ78_08285 [Emergomyces pasteurianus Ep9510]|uniref:Uncharacterized protein n=1 Tax=Emergomyces pasteurianus Ep9510 TaxID=1447872 RepID=A0A1J9P344_9EURO|nr:hypothetical protein AJ78_08285 [Emergomyces pasteurianus Ep9510]